MDNSKPEFAQLSFDFMKMIAEESAVLSKKAGEFLEFEDVCPLVSIVKPELVIMHMSLNALSQTCIEALETCLIDDDNVVSVPADQFLRIADASALGMDAFKEAEKHISFVFH